MRHQNSQTLFEKGYPRSIAEKLFQNLPSILRGEHFLTIVFDEIKFCEQY